MRYWKGILPQTDDLLSRAINIRIGVSDAGLGSAFAVTARDRFEAVHARTEAFRQVAREYLR